MRARVGLIEYKILYRVKDSIALAKGLSSHGMGEHVGWVVGWAGGFAKQKKNKRARLYY